MIVHPIVLGVLAVDGMVLVLEAGAAVFAFQALLSWNPANASETQLRLEARSESAEIAAGLAFWTFAFGSLLFVVALTNVLPDIVPGAMCGTGVLNAMGDAGWKAIGLRLAAVSLLYTGWASIRLNRSDPTAPLTLLNARLRLFGLPILALAVAYTTGALWSLNVDQPVNCCAVVYDAFESTSGASRLPVISDGGWLSVFAALSVALLFAAVLVERQKTPAAGAAAGLLMLALAWMPASAIALVTVLSAYIYGVLHHHCPWCLFLPEHGMAGFVLFGVWMMIGLEAATAWLATSLCRKEFGLEQTACRRCRSAAQRTALGVVLFAMLSGAPALIWRIRFGVWL